MAKDVLTDEQIDALILSCPMESYGLLCELPQDMIGSQFKTTARRWARAFLAAAEPAIRADERERCAAVCDDKERRKWHILTEGGAMEGFGLLDCAHAIRQLGAGSKVDAS